ncbi:MAG: DegV family EDD domain-containing protein [Spirochaetales bacterium]|nr:DegV family EDD domain-containing protein [Spirochaetales bacterium]
MVLVADSAIQIEYETIQELGIRVVEYPLFVNGEEYPVSISMSREEKDKLRAILKDKNNNVTTSGLRVDDIFRTFEKAGSEKILFMHQSVRASTATVAVLKRVKERAADFDVEYFDTHHLTAAHSVQVLTAARLIREGADFDELMRLLRRNRERTRHLGAVYDLFYLHRTGRIGLAKAFLGTAMKIIPLLGSTEEPGVLKSLGKAKNYVQANQKLVQIISDDLAAKESDGITALISVIGPHEEEAAHLKAMLGGQDFKADVEIHYTNHSNMPHAGPDFYDIGFIAR